MACRKKKNNVPNIHVDLFIFSDNKQGVGATLEYIFGVKIPMFEQIRQFSLFKHISNIFIQGKNIISH